MDTLVKQAMQGDAHAYAQLIRAHAQYLYKVAWSMLGNDQDVADAVQEVTLSCWRKLGALQHPEYFRTWMTRALINECNGMLRQKAQWHQRVVPLENARELADAAPAQDELEWRELLGMLDEKYRLAMYLHYVEGFKAREIAEMCDVAVSTVTTRLERGRKMLQEIWSCADEEGASA